MSTAGSAVRQRTPDVRAMGQPLASDDPRHGTRNGYSNLGCRCADCSQAHSDYVWRGGFTHTKSRLKTYKENYLRALAAGYSPAEARRRRFWSDPLARPDSSTVGRADKPGGGPA